MYERLYIRKMEDNRVIKVIHDLNNMLCVNSGNTQLLIDIEDRKYQSTLLNNNLKCIIKMGKLLEELRKEINTNNSDS